MGALITRDDGQLRRIENAIARITSGTPAEQRRTMCLLAALENEKAELLQCRRRARRGQASRLLAA